MYSVQLFFVIEGASPNLGNNTQQAGPTGLPDFTKDFLK